MSTEITRAGDADRQQYYDRLDQLYASGHIASENELGVMRGEVSRARSFRALNMILDGMPPPALPPEQRRIDMGIPRHFIPPCVAGGSAGLLIAVLPSATLAGMHGVTVNFVTAVTLVVGVVIFIASLVTLGLATYLWEEEEPDKAGRRFRDSHR